MEWTHRKTGPDALYREARYVAETRGVRFTASRRGSAIRLTVKRLDDDSGGLLESRIHQTVKAAKEAAREWTFEQWRQRRITDAQRSLSKIERSARGIRTRIKWLEELKPPEGPSDN